MRTSRAFTLGCAVIAATAVASGQTSGTTGEQPAVFSSSADLVVLNATVTDSAGRFITGLRRDAFTVFEDGRPQTVSFFDELDAPVTIGLVIDSSGSMRGNRARVAAAVAAFAEASHPDDEFFALAFNEYVSSLMSAGLGFTREPSMLQEALARDLPLRGRTALFDAVSAALAAISGGHYERKVLVVVSDGGDNASIATFDETLARVQRSNVVVYTVAIVDPMAPDANPKRLRRLAQVTGGLAFEPSDVRKITDAFGKVSRDIRGGYTLAYVPSNAAHGDEQRRLRVRVKTPDGRQHAVRTRATYIARATD